MILNQLTIQALGPYKGKELIDFDTLNHARLFAISGNTGAGKTAIFDGICYALYGRASGQHRSNAEELRCIYADDADYTEATLEFTVHGRRYRARRQMGHIKANNKSKTGGAMELHRWVTEDEHGEGRWESMLESGKVSEMNEKVTELTGLEADQFRQIVMLPQGEFEKLLLAKAEDKKKILRQIFNTSLYQRFTEKLDQRRKEAEQEYLQYRQSIRSREDSLEELLKDEDNLSVHEFLEDEERNTYRVMEALEQDITLLAEQAKKLEKQLEKQDELIQKADEKYHQAKGNNLQIEELETQYNNRKALQAGKTEMEKKQQSLEEALKARKIEHLYRRKIETGKDYEEKAKMLRISEEEQQIAEEKLTKAQEVWEKQKAEEPSKKEKEIEYQRMVEMLPKVKDLSAKKETLLKHQKESEGLKKELDRLNKGLETLQQQLKEKKEERESLTSLLEEEPQLLRKESSLSRQHKNLQELIKYKEEEEKLQHQSDQAGQLWQQCHDKTKDLENQWVENQASYLAEKLEEGEACPVCGSCEHPQKAAGVGAAIGREQLEEAKEKEHKASARHVQIKTKLETTQQAIAKMEENLEESLEQKNSSTEVLREIEAQWTKERQSLEEKLKNLEKQRKKDQKLKKAIDAGEKEMDPMTEQLKSAEEKRQEMDGKIASLRGSIESLQESIPEKLMDLKPLEAEIKALEKAITKAQQAYEEAEKLYNGRREAKATADANAKNAKENARESRETMEMIGKQWQEELLEEGFADEEAYEKAHMPPEQIKGVQDELQEYRDQWALTEEKIKHLEKELENVEKADLEVLRQHCNQLRQEQKNRQKEYAAKEALVREVKNIKESMEKDWKILQQVEEKRNRVTALFQCANGTGNQQKLALETYVLQHYFHRVLAAANLRLDQLTMGRYRLVADEDREKHGGRSGLGIDVIDSFNEQQRSVRTFSGGEKFNASLCLALGLFDVIQSESGGTEMKTMFIDEGFGSLDTQESLPRAIQMLTQIQETGRVIGVISHVSEMKDQLPAVLEVRKKPDGSSATSIRINA